MRSPGAAGPPWPATAAASVVSTASAGGVSTLPQACGAATCAGRTPRRSWRHAVATWPALSISASWPVTHAAFAITAAGGRASAARTAKVTAWLVPAGRAPRSRVQLDPAVAAAHDHRTSLAPASKVDSAGTVSVSTAAPTSWLPLFDAVSVNGSTTPGSTEPPAKLFTRCRFGWPVVGMLVAPQTAGAPGNAAQARLATTEALAGSGDAIATA